MVEPLAPVWLKTAFAVFGAGRGRGLVHGWCAEKENGGKGGSGQGKIWAKVGFLPIHGCSWD